MSYADYAICPGCDRKALYMGDGEAPEGIEVWHAECRKKAAGAAWTRLRDFLDSRLSVGEPAPEFRLLTGEFTAYRAVRELIAEIEGAAQ